MIYEYPIATCVFTVMGIVGVTFVIYFGLVSILRSYRERKIK